MANLLLLCCILVMVDLKVLAQRRENKPVSEYSRQEIHTLSQNIINTLSMRHNDPYPFVFITSINTNSRLLQYKSCILDMNGQSSNYNDGRQIADNCDGTYIIANKELASGIQQNSLLIQLPKLWDIYMRHRGRQPTMMLLYIPTFLRSECSTFLLNFISSLPNSKVPNIVVGYTSEGRSQGNKQMSLNEESICLTRNATVEVFHHHCLHMLSRHAQKETTNTKLFVQDRTLIKNDERQCTVADTFQGCLFYCLDQNVTCCGETTHTESIKANFINSLFANCGKYEFEKCAFDWINKQVGNGCDCIRRTFVTTEILRCTRHCRSAYVMSNFLNPKNTSSFTGILQNTNELHKFVEEPVNCKDTRLEGQLCTVFNDDYITAGNSICRPDTPCGYYDEDYSWCYIDYSNNWDYCCTDECLTRGEDYLWCHSGDTWEYCGDGGTINIMNRPCIHNHPCGLHDYSYFWCYEDVDKNWEYCCHPHSYCNNYEEDYNWCYTGREFYSRWDYCYNVGMTKNVSSRTIV